ncbi:hypothetical protein [Arthrobacter woluwensis]|uniref:DUF3168 domain-containing protein n=1 Tax=Arthrobacter woluwensis TaxID=156980 RepID=A0A1H4TFT6_9MICC|nr:hypothetical protein [Arthrobacter woluwensis]SEC54984.1 hypothetical protein SAMN04489745_3152 [Arthrobacter woluwensis]SEC91155.1 hypothetical protein SAMN04489745_3493 [Arthrobacter woluwensis]SEC93827.1 hypothetical protein SAMN04489745_3514 [Arthrobacter woluwensis]SEC96817.1 hypothetical protein SAMN04489745_3579 [Arthrobacter woluwensis]SEC99829.1 hypothetical protein SAMN04489745_3645 [Arthrobacter woluwensis]
MANQVVLFGNAMAAARLWLIARIPGLTVVGTEPNPRPDQFVLISDAGGRQFSPIHEKAFLMVDTWGPTKNVAKAKAQLVRAHLSALSNDTITVPASADSQAMDVVIYWAHPMGGLVDIPDPDAKIPRYRQNFELAVRGTPI